MVVTIPSLVDFKVREIEAQRTTYFPASGPATPVAFSSLCRPDITLVSRIFLYLLFPVFEKPIPETCSIISKSQEQFYVRCNIVAQVSFTK